MPKQSIETTREDRADKYYVDHWFAYMSRAEVAQALERFADAECSALEKENRELDNRNYDLEKFLHFCGVKIDFLGYIEPIKDIDTAIVMGWRTHCTSGELKDGSPRKDFLDYGLGFKDGHLAGRSEAFDEVESLTAQLAAAREALEEAENLIEYDPRPQSRRNAVKALINKLPAAIEAAGERE